MWLKMEAKVVWSTAIDILQWLSTTKLLQTHIASVGTVHKVQIDEGVFRHKQEVKRVFTCLKLLVLRLTQHHVEYAFQYHSKRKQCGIWACEYT